MPLFQNSAGKLTKISSVILDKEKNLQKLVEENLFEVLELYFIASEYPTTSGGRIDTIALGTDGAPVIIEYKRNKSDNVINQALSYLKWLKAQKKEFFEMLVVKKLGVEKSINIDWKNPRIICIAESYNKFDIDTLEVLPLRLELHKFRYYQNGVFSLERVNHEENAEDFDVELVQNDSFKNIVTNGGEQGVSLMTKKVIDLDFHVSKGLPFVKEIFYNLRAQIFQLDENIEERITSPYVSYRVSKSFCELIIQKNRIVLHLRPINYIDPDNRVEKIPDTHKWTLDRRFYVCSESDAEYGLKLLDQSYRDIL